MAIRRAPCQPSLYDSEFGIGAGAEIRTSDPRFKSSPRTPQDAFSNLLLNSILRISPPRGSPWHPGLAIQIGYTCALCISLWNSQTRPDLDLGSSRRTLGSTTPGLDCRGRSWVPRRSSRPRNPQPAEGRVTTRSTHNRSLYLSSDLWLGRFVRAAVVWRGFRLKAPRYRSHHCKGILNRLISNLKVSKQLDCKQAIMVDNQEPIPALVAVRVSE